jgi:hypothetical protein
MLSVKRVKSAKESVIYKGIKWPFGVKNKTLFEGR